MFGNKISNEELIIKWKNDLIMEGKSNGTIKAYEGVLEKFKKHIDGKCFLKVEKSDIQDFLSDNASLSARTLRRYYSTVSSFYWWMVEDRGYLQEHPMPQWRKKPKINKPGVEEEIEILEYEEKKKVIKYFMLKYQERNLVLFNFMLGSGVRREEVVNIKVEDFNFKKNCVKVTGKGSKTRFVYLGEDVINMIKRYIRSKKITSGYIFLRSDGEPITKHSVNKIFESVKEETGIEKLHPHITRHTYAVESLANGMTLEVLQEQLGHSDITTTRIYAKTLDKTRLEQAKKYSPKIMI